MGYVLDPATGQEKVVDLNVPDPEVLVAYAAQGDFMANLTPCEKWTYHVQNVAIDPFGTEAKLDVQLPPSSEQLDTHHSCIPARYEGVPVEQSLVETIEVR